MKMKTLKTLLLFAAVCCISFVLPSCLNDDNDFSLGKYQLEIVSVKSAGNAPYFRADDGTTLWPAAGYVDLSRLGEGQRVWLNMTLLGDSTMGAQHFDYYIRVNQVDTVLTKRLAPDLGADNDAVYGTDPVEIRSMRTGNGHLTIRFAAKFGDEKKHWVNLVKNDRIEDETYPIHLEFRHNAQGDPQLSTQEGWVCFDLGDLPTPYTKTVDLIVKVITPDGPKEYKINYNPNDK